MEIYGHILEFVSRQEKQMFSLLRDMVTIQSGSYNKDGVDKVVRLISNFFSGTSFLTEEIRQANYGNHLIVSSPAANVDDRSVLIAGHTDTVFPSDTSFIWYREDEQKAYGPGVIDMKGGLVVGMFAMKALSSMGMDDKIPVRFLFNSDEEIGSPSSKDLIEDLASRSTLGLVLECGSLDGSVVTGRKGKMGIRLTLEGGAGHAAFAGESKPSAILELAHKIIELESTGDVDSGLSINVGKIEGGSAPNVVAKHAEAHIDIRYVRPEQREKILKRVESVVRETRVPGVRASFKIVSERPPMPQTEGNRRLYHVIRGVGKKIGLEIKDEFRNGVSDANFIAARGIPVVDGLGPIGDLDHSEKEYMIKRSLPERCALFALALIESWERRKQITG